MTPMVLCRTVTMRPCGSFRLIGHCTAGGTPGATLGSRCRLGSSCGMSNQDSTESRTGKRQAGSLPGFCTLLGMNLSGKAAKISQLTWRTVMIMASTTRPRRPFILRNKNVTNSPMISSSLHHVGTWQSQDRRKSFGARAIQRLELLRLQPLCSFLKEGSDPIRVILRDIQGRSAASTGDGQVDELC